MKPWASQVAIMCVGSALLLIGCTTAPKEPTPTLTDLRAGESDLERYEPPPLSTAPRAEATMRVLGFSIDDDLSQAWELVDAEAFPPMTRGVWLANGIRLGVLHNAKLSAFFDELPRQVSSSQTRLLGYDLPTPLRRSPRLVADFYADLTVPPFASRREFFSGGRLQLLTRLMPDQGFVTMELTPHHFKPRLTLEPRTAMEKQLDGRMFEELTVRIAMPADRVLIVGYELPADGRVPAEEQPGLIPTDPTEPPEPTTGTQAAAPVSVYAQSAPPVPTPQPTSDPQAPPESALGRVDLQALPLNLGRGLLTVPGRESPTQLLLLISVERID